MDSYLNEKPFRQDLQDYQEFFVCHFPESLKKIQLIQLILSTAFIKIESIPLIFSIFRFN